MSHTMPRGKACARPDGHPGECRSVEAAAKKLVNARRVYNQDPTVLARRAERERRRPTPEMARARRAEQERVRYREQREAGMVLRGGQRVIRSREQEIADLASAQRRDDRSWFQEPQRFGGRAVRRPVYGLSALTVDEDRIVVEGTPWDWTNEGRTTRRKAAA